MESVEETTAATIQPPPAPEEALAATVEETENKDSQSPKEVKKEDEGAQNLKSTLLISGAIVAVIGAILAISKKMRASM